MGGSRYPSEGWIGFQTRVDLQVRASGHASKCRNVLLRGAVANDKHVTRFSPAQQAKMLRLIWD